MEEQKPYEEPFLADAQEQDSGQTIYSPFPSPLPSDDYLMQTLPTDISIEQQNDYGIDRFDLCEVDISLVMNDATLPNQLTSEDPNFELPLTLFETVSSETALNKIPELEPMSSATVSPKLQTSNHSEKMSVSVIDVPTRTCKKKVIRIENMDQMNINLDDINNKILSLKEVEKVKMRKPRFTKAQRDALNKWYDSHSKNPYPNNYELNRLATLTGLTVKQIRTYYVNRRIRSPDRLQHVK